MNLILAHKSDIKSKYEHFVPPVKLNSGWPKNYNFELVESVSHIHSVFKKHNFTPGKSVMSFDLETSDLDPENGFIVGVGFSLDGKTGYYVAINHFDKEFNLGKEGLDAIYSYLIQAKVVIVYNLRFDFRYMEYYGYNKDVHKYSRMKAIGYDMSKVKYYDVSIACWLADTNIRMPKLEDSSRRFLGITQQSFEEVTSGLDNFYYVDPKNAAFYCGADAINTYLLVPATHKYYKEAKLAGEMDNRILYPLMYYEQEKIMIDGDHIYNLMSEVRDRLTVLEKSVHKGVGYVFNLNSPQQVAEAFQSIGVNTGSFTAKTGNMQTGVDLLKRVINGKEDASYYKIVKDFIEYKELYKALSSYIEVLYKEYKKRGFLRCGYKTQVVPTGRLASGKDEKNSFFSEINVQSIPKPLSANYYVVKVGDNTVFSKKDRIILGYRFYPVQYTKDPNTGKKEIVDGRTLYGDSCLGVVEGFSDKLNIRKAFLPNVLGEEYDPDEWIFVSVDYSGQELRIPANLSREPIWVNELSKEGGDVHKATAIQLEGEENYCKEARGRAKGANFGVLYGQTGENFALAHNMKTEEGEAFVTRFKKTLKTLFSWVRRVETRGAREGTVYTYFGRPRRVRHYFKTNKGFAKRTCINTTVQGTGSDILKISLIKLWSGLFKKHVDNIRFLITVHDEVDFASRRHCLIEHLSKAVEIMTLDLPEWPVKMEVGVSLGYSWGEAYPFIPDKKGSFIPKYESFGN